MHLIGRGRYARESFPERPAGSTTARSLPTTQNNPGAIGPANPVTFAATPFTSSSGQVRIDAAISISAQGGTLGVLDTLLLTILRDGVAVPGSGSSVNTVEGNATGEYFVGGFALDRPPAGPHTYSLQVTISNAHTGGANIGRANLFIQDL
jgi:hypothetical protein